MIRAWRNNTKNDTERTIIGLKENAAIVFVCSVFTKGFWVHCRLAYAIYALC